MDMITQTKDIVTVAQELGLDLEEAGDELRCHCPHHGDDNPSLYINVAKQKWICFGCRRGGGTVGLYAFIRQCPFFEALEAVTDGPAFAAYLQMIRARAQADAEDDGDAVAAHMFNTLLQAVDDPPTLNQLVAVAVSEHPTTEALLSTIA